MNRLIRRIFGSGIKPEQDRALEENVARTETALAYKRPALYQTLMKVDDNVKVFRTNAGKMRLIRGGHGE